MSDRVITPSVIVRASASQLEALAITEPPPSPVREGPPPAQAAVDAAGVASGAEGPPPGPVHTPDAAHSVGPLAGAMLGVSDPSQRDVRAPSPARGPLDPPVASWDRYEFLGLLGRGGMGAVYKARDRRIGRIVALKFVLGADDRLKKRFLQEARAQVRIQHPGVCRVYEVGEVEGHAYIAMEFIDGRSLHAAKGLLSLDEKISIVAETAEILHVAHESGVIHRDVKPAKVIPVGMRGGVVRGVSARVRTGRGAATAGRQMPACPPSLRCEMMTRWGNRYASTDRMPKRESGASI